MKNTLWRIGVPGGMLTLVLLLVLSSQFMSPSSEPTTLNSEHPASLLVAGGCFWCVEADAEKLSGVLEAVSGYAGGTIENPTYDTYAAGGHREVVEIIYDPTQVQFEDIIIYALKHMDPTDGAGSFYDRGVQYAPALYYETDAQKEIIVRVLEEFTTHGPYQKPLSVLVEPRPRFWPAEAYHQDYAQGTLSALRYQHYRRASGRDDFIAQHWGDDRSTTVPWRAESMGDVSVASSSSSWEDYQKPALEVLRNKMEPLAFRVTQEDGTERAHSSPLNATTEPGIYIDVLSGEPLFSSRDKFDSGTGWPSFTKPINPAAVVEHEDRRLWMVRTEVRSRIADNHLGHVFPDGPADRGGLRYCMNGAALRFVPLDEMESQGYGAYRALVE